MEKKYYPREDLSKENQGKRLAPKPKIYGEGKKKPGSGQERFKVSTKYGIVDGSYEDGDIVRDDMVRDDETKDQREFQAKGELKDLNMRIPRTIGGKK